MRGIFQKRGALAFLASLWIFAASVQSLAPMLSAFISGPETAVAAQAIEAGSPRQGICKHHPQGCPADCFCPKTGFVEEEASARAEPLDSGAGRLRETTWAECSESRASKGGAPSSVVYLPPLRAEGFLLDVSENLRPSAGELPRAMLRAAPAKIPIV
jgi:hypothetical protein